MSQLELRIAGPKDASIVRELVSAFRDYLGATSPTDTALEKRLAAALGDPTFEFVCAFLDDRPVGYTQTRRFASIWTPGHEAHLEDLFVVESARGQAVGRELLRAAIRRAREGGAGELTLTTNERNEPAQRLYHSEGLRAKADAVWEGGHEVRWVIGLAGA